MQFKRARKTDARLRLGLVGPSGSGKTYTALSIAAKIADGRPVAVMDSERGSAAKYADLFAFDVLEMREFSPLQYCAAIEAAENAGYAVLVIDSLSHAWVGTGGALEIVDRKTSGANKFAAWRDVTPMHNKMIDTIIGSRCHIIATMRVKTEWVVEQNERGKAVPRKIGMAPVQREGMEYEFDVVADIDNDHRLTCSKTRCPAVDGRIYHLITESDKFIEPVAAWLKGEAADPAPAQEAPAAAEPAPAKPARSPKVELAELVAQWSGISPKDKADFVGAVGALARKGGMEIKGKSMTDAQASALLAWAQPQAAAGVDFFEVIKQEAAA